MRAMVLSAGLGTRLRPYSEYLPKPLFPVLGVTALEWAIRRTHVAGADGAVVNTHYLADQVEAFVSSSDLPIPVVLSHEPTLLGTGGGIAAARDMLASEGFFLLHNSDAFVACNLREIVDFFLAERADAVLMVTRDPNRMDAHVVGVQPGTHRVLSLNSGPGDHLDRFMYTGIGVFSDKIFDFLPKQGASCLVRNALIPMIQAELRVLAYFVDLFVDIGTPKGLMQAQAKAMERLPRIFSDCGLTPPRQRAPGVFSVQEPQPVVTIKPPVFIGKDVNLRAGITVGPNAFISDRAELNRSVHDSLVLSTGMIISKD